MCNQLFHSKLDCERQLIFVTISGTFDTTQVHVQTDKLPKDIQTFSS